MFKSGGLPRAEGQKGAKKPKNLYHAQNIILVWVEGSKSFDLRPPKA